MNENTPMRILEMIDNGEISADEGARMLQGLTSAGEFPLAGWDGVQDRDTSGLETAENTSEPAKLANEAVQGEFEYPVDVDGLEDQDELLQGAAGAEGLPPGAAGWRRWWTIPLWIGVGLTILGGALMGWAAQTSGLGFWFLCASLPMTLGIIMILLAFQSRSSPWIYLRVQQGPGEWPQRFTISFPVPIRPTVWILRNFGHRIPNLKDTSLDEIILAVGESTSPENPIYIQANEDDGEQVEIYIG